MGWNDYNIIKTLKKDIQYIPVTVSIENYKVFIYSKTPDKIWEKMGQLKKFTSTQLFEKTFDYHVKRRTLANANWKYFFTNWVEFENPIIDLVPSLRTIYPKGYEFSERKLGA
ncbi:hypothetical protein GLOIN_2v1781826 [Rhizophagus clarus]|uniref:Uncharacterized protein n=1 Tax=Rhizophagus clarus TaxID=94130 RepID=A0A8H3MH98_9GLOM|nr:hypothetical protein GLOIN_2v1781826 [Rhizophagus clarus]